MVCEVDLKVGGSFRFVLRSTNGRDMGMRGVYREIVPPERSVHVESFDDATLLYPSQEVRDAVMKSGMEHGAAECYDKLSEMLASTPACGASQA